MRLTLIRKYWLYFALIVLGACSAKSKDTELFEHYMHNAFGKSLPDEAQYIIVSSTACGACAEHVYKLAKGKNTGFIYIFPRYYRDKFESLDSNVLIDTTIRIEKLALHQRKIAKILVKNKNVSKVIVYDPRNIAKIAE